MNNAHTRHATQMMFERYLEILEGYFDEKQEPYIPKECRINHLKWMCQTCINNISDYPIDKLSLWLGFVQGVCVANGFTTVDEERNYSRPLFHKAYKLENKEIPQTLENHNK